MYGPPGKRTTFQDMSYHVIVLWCMLIYIYIYIYTHIYIYNTNTHTNTNDHNNNNKDNNNMYVSTRDYLSDPAFYRLYVAWSTQQVQGVLTCLFSSRVYSALKCILKSLFDTDAETTVKWEDSKTITWAKWTPFGILRILHNTELNEAGEPLYEICKRFSCRPHLEATDSVAMFYPFSQFCEIDTCLLSLQKQPKPAPNLFQRGGVEYVKYHWREGCLAWEHDAVPPPWVKELRPVRKHGIEYANGPNENTTLDSTGGDITPRVWRCLLQMLITCL